MREMSCDFSENYEDFKVLSGTDFEFPLPQFTTCIGFFLVYLIEEICVKVSQCGLFFWSLTTHSSTFRGGGGGF